MKLANVTNWVLVIPVICIIDISYTIFHASRRFTVFLTKDRFLNHFPIKRVVVCHPPQKFGLFICLFFTCNEFHSIFSVKEGEARMKLWMNVNLIKFQPWFEWLYLKLYFWHIYDLDFLWICLDMNMLSFICS